MKENTKAFLTNFLAVVLGIVLTFLGEGLISARRERADVVSSLKLVKTELQDNLGYLALADTAFMEYKEASDFLIRHQNDYYSAPQDSLYMYCNIPLSSMDISSSEAALELLKASGLFTKIKDLDLSLEIIHAYGNIADQMKSNKYIFEKKNEYLEEALYGEAKKALAEDGLTAARLWTAIVSTDEGRQFLRELQRLQMYYNPDTVRDLTLECIRKIDEYIR